MRALILPRFGFQHRLLAGFAVAMLATIAVTAIGLFSVRTLSRQVVKLGRDRMMSQREILIASAKVRELAAHLRDALGFTVSHDAREQHLADLLAARAVYRQSIDNAAQNLDAGERARLDQFRTQARQWADINDGIIAELRTLDEARLDSPLTLQRDLAQFRGDHLKVLAEAEEHLVAGTTYSGSDDPSACGFGRWLARYRTQSPEFRAALAAIGGHHVRMHAAVGKFQQLLAAHQADEARVLMNSELMPELRSAVDTIVQLSALPARQTEKLTELRTRFAEQSEPTRLAALVILDDLTNEVIAHADTATAAANTLGRRSVRNSLVFGLAGMTIALGVGLVTIRSLSRQLRGVATELGEGARQTASVAEEIAGSTTKVARSASSQAAALEETSASLEEVSSMSRQNIDRARDAAARATAARTSAERGETQMAELSQAMSAIHQASTEIRKIVKTIDEIAFQTNILALNAAVEAARAGEAGMGFAVVAEEVRALAQRSAIAAKETATLVDSAAARSDRGAGLSGEVAERLHEILAASRAADSLMAEIVAGSKEQAGGFDQIKKATVHLDQITQSNAAHAEENASAAEELQGQTASLHEMVATLLGLLDGGRGTVTHTAAARAPVADEETTSRAPAARPPAPLLSPRTASPLPPPDSSRRVAESASQTASASRAASAPRKPA